MRTIRCKRCDNRMYEDEEGDGSIYCPNCGWEIGTPIEDYEFPPDDELYE